MTSLIVQLGDIHIESQNDPIFRRLDQLANCVAAECTKSTKQCIFLLTGDFAQTGSKHEFEHAASFVRGMTDKFATASGVDPCVACIPGNHDLDLSGDQTKRDKLIGDLTAAECESRAITDDIIAPLASFNHFAKTVQRNVNIDWQAQPFLNTVDFDLENTKLRLQLLNSAWMSQIHEKHGSLYFPLPKLTDAGLVESGCHVISAIHHPMNWFRQPDVMRQLREWLETTSDLIVTGHEHANDFFGKVRNQGLYSVDYLEGGVLQERSDKRISTFNVLRFDANDESFQLKRFEFDDGVYTSENKESPHKIRVNRSRRSSSLTPTPEFSAILQSTSLPLANASELLLSHEDLYGYPDLRERNTSDPENPWTRLPSDCVSIEVRRKGVCLVASDALGGKTSFAKQLCLDSIAEGKPAILLNCEDAVKLDSPDAIRKWIARTANKQYGKNAFEKLTQTSKYSVLVVIDDLHLLRKTTEQATAVLEAASQIFDSTCATVDTDFLLEEARLLSTTSESLMDRRTLHLCEFGFRKVEDLTRKWFVTSGEGDADEETIRKTCKTIEQVLRVNAMAHHPWVLIVLLQQATSSDQLAAKNGSYGFLYQAVVTCALSKTSKKLDIMSKYTYLAELAFRMYSQSVATLDKDEVSKFHAYHHSKFRVPIDMESILKDFESVGILRRSAGRLSFRDKYSYWFFVSWFLSENIHDKEYSDYVQRLCNEMHHEDSANILVFLSHFAKHPVVIETILRTAKSLLGNVSPAVLDTNEDLAVLNVMNAEDMLMSLPTTDPDENYRRMLEEKDKHFSKRDPRSTDGRTVQPAAPESPSDEFMQLMETLRAAMKAIDILGQVLRNGVGGITFDRKLQIVEEVYLLARRVNGFVLVHLPSDIPRWADSLNRKFHEHHVGDTMAQRLQRISNAIVGTLSFITYSLSRRVSHAIAHENLEEVFDEANKNDVSIPARLFDLSSRLDLVTGVPVNRTLELHNSLRGNVIARNALRALVANYLYLHRVDYQTHQELCEKLKISYDPSRLVTSTKKSLALPALAKKDDNARKKAKVKRRQQRNSRKRNR